MTARPLALSTMWSQQDRFADLANFAAKAKDLGYSHVELSYIVRPDGIEQVRRTGIGITSLHAPAPLMDVEGRRNFDLNLASLNEEERIAAVLNTKRTLDEAASFGARRIVIHLGAVEGDAPRADLRLRQANRTDAPQSRKDAALLEMRRARSMGQPAHFAAARQSLSELAEHALRRRVTIGLETRFHCHEIPDVDEALALIADYPPQVVGYWHDVGHAEVLHRLGMVPLNRWLDELGDRCVGAHLHDVEGIVDHRAPGGGTADWAYIASRLPEDAIRTFEINQGVDDAAVAAAIPFLRERGVV